VYSYGYVLGESETKKRNASKHSINSKKVSSSATRPVGNKNSTETGAQHPSGCLVQVSTRYERRLNQIGLFFFDVLHADKLHSPFGCLIQESTVGILLPVSLTRLG